MKANRQSALAGLLQARIDESMKKGASLPPLELGTIDGSMNLLVDGLPAPLQGYMVCRQLTLGAKDEVLTKMKEGGDVLIPEKMQKLQPGDRVLVAWAGSIPVVIDIVLDKSAM
jgi:hypothetical protein